MVDTGASNAPALTDSLGDTFLSDMDATYTYDLGFVPASLIGFTGGIWYINYNDDTQPEHTLFSLVGNVSSKVLELGRIPNNYNSIGSVVSPSMIIRDWALGLNLEQYFSDDTDVSMVITTTNFFGEVSWTLLASRA